ncbi:hypothetical protein [Paraburkholderia saeva]|nr:hypothetical protein [Paraburkholderia saeva]
MDHHQLEKDILHLEQIVTRISPDDRIPLSYWQNRVQTISSAVVVPTQRGRLKRLIDALDLLEARSK